jgi:hypothetical protein
MKMIDLGVNSLLICFFVHEITQKKRSSLRNNFFQFGFMFLGAFLELVNWFIFIIGIFLGVFGVDFG